MALGAYATGLTALRLRALQAHVMHGPRALHTGPMGLTPKGLSALGPGALQALWPTGYRPYGPYT